MILDFETLKNTLRLDVPTDADDATLIDAIADGTALVEAYIRTPIERRPVTYVCEPRPSVDVATYAVTDRAQLTFPVAPIDGTTVVVTDPNGDLVDASAYTVDARTGTLTVTADPFAPGPHVVTADAGLELGDDYALRDLPALRAAVRDFVVWFFEQRNPAAEYEAAGGGVATTFNKSADAGLPARIRTALDTWRASRSVALRRRPIPSRV